MNSSKSRLSTRCWAAVLLAAACQLFYPAKLQAQDEIITIGTVGGRLILDDSGAYQLFISWLNQRVEGYRFQVLPFATIEELNDAVDRGEIAFSMLIPAGYVELAMRQEVRAIATVTQLAGAEVYPWLAGAVFTLAEREDIGSLEQVRGKRVIALAPLALGSWLSALREWRALGINETRDFASVEFVFNFEEIMDRVCAGSADVGVLSSVFFMQYRDRCQRPLKILTSPSVTPDPRYPVEVSTRLYPEVAFVAIGRNHNEKLVRQLAQALLEIEPGSAIAESADVGGFTAPLSYAPVVELMQELRLGPYQNFGQFTFMEFVRQHSGKVLGFMLLFLGILSLAFARSQWLNRKLKQSEQFQHLLFEKSNLPMAVLERNSLRFLDLNPAALNVYGYKERQELIGNTPLLVSALLQKNGEASAHHFNRVEELFANGKTQVVEWLHQRPDGSTWEAEVHVLPFSFGEDDFLQATIVDVSERNRIREERERMEQQLQHAQRLESLGRLSGAIAHDFNNLLTVINGYSELLLLTMDKDAKVYRTLLEIAQAGWRARELTNQLLTFGRRQIARVQPMDVNAMIIESGNMFRSLLGEKIQLQTALETSIGFTLADSGQLNQVLMNMLVNAKDAMPEGGKCFISTDKRELQAAEAGALGVTPGEFVVIAVTDTGSGMSQETQDHVFEPFFSTKGDKGTGIGLATAYGIIRQSGGVITFQSEAGIGTTFTICLPVTEGAYVEQEDHEQQSLDLKASSPRTILVVEDQPDVRLYACSVLRSAGYKVLEADSGGKALELAQQQRGRIDLLFTDVVMPGMNGRELAERFQDTWPGIRILFTSGYADDEVALHGVAQDKILFISKPYIPQHLLSKLKIILG